MTEHHDLTAPQPRAGRMTPGEILRNIAIKTSMRPPTDSQGHPTQPPQAVTYEYDECGRITGATTSTTTELSYSAADLENSPTMRAMREKAARNAEAIRQFVDEAKNDPNAHTDYQH